jgi:hypothetical protein
MVGYMDGGEATEWEAAQQKAWLSLGVHEKHAPVTVQGVIDAVADIGHVATM